MYTNKIMHIVGNRPQFIKLAPLYHELESRGYEQLILHTGQHYDENLSNIFFEQFKVEKPYKNLEIGSGSHAEMTAKAVIGIERCLLDIHPKVVILYGDTDSTLAGALAASKLDIPIAHVEGGVRTYNKKNPEECNRIITDHVSSIIFCPDEYSVKNATKENLGAISYNTGDIMYDAFLMVGEDVSNDNSDYILMTWHRQENTNSKYRMDSILNFVEQLDERVICPLHPRTKKCLMEYGLWDRVREINNLQIIEPVGYWEMVGLMRNSKLILTDSGGVSKESSFAGSKCLFFADLDIWYDLEKVNWIQKLNLQSEKSIKKALVFAKEAKKYGKGERPCFYGDGHAAHKMATLLEEKNLVCKG